MKHLVEFAVRIAAFLFTFYILLEFIVGCKVGTPAGISTMVISAVLVGVLFANFRAPHIQLCTSCGQTTS
jgi:hypothetical protein